jgi:DNA-binding protein HU-beta
VADINRAVLCDEIAQMTGLPKGQVNQVVGALTYATQLHVKRGERVGLVGFGSWEQVKRSARIARNPRTGAPVKVKATKAPRFRAGATFKAVVGGGKLDRPTGLYPLGARSTGTSTGRRGPGPVARSASGPTSRSPRGRSSSPTSRSSSSRRGGRSSAR